MREQGGEGGTVETALEADIPGRHRSCRFDLDAEAAAGYFDDADGCAVGSRRERVGSILLIRDEDLDFDVARESTDAHFSEGRTTVEDFDVLERQ